MTEPRRARDSTAASTPTKPTQSRRSAAPTPASSSSPSTPAKAHNLRNGSLSSQGSPKPRRSGHTTSRVERVRKTTGVGYVGLNVSEQDLENVDVNDNRAIVWFDIDNTLYHKSTRIADLMGERIHAYFLGLGLPEDEATQLHRKYYSEHGLAIRGLLKNHAGIDPLDYDRRVDGSLPLDDILKPEAELTSLIQDLDRTKCRVFGLTNAYKTHGLRCIRLLGLEHMFEGIVYCDYAAGPLFCCKPDKGYFVAAADLAGVSDTTKFFFVDDSAKNIKAAKEMGWRSSVLYNEDEPLPSDGGAGESRIQGKSLRTLNENILALNGHKALSTTNFDEEAVKQAIRSLPQQARIRFLNVVLDAASPSDLLAIRHSLDRHLRSTRDVVSHLPDDIVMRIFEKLPIQDLVRCRLVSKKWLSIAANPNLWRSHALALTESDPEPVQQPTREAEWESLVQGLYFRERNWSLGLAQSIQFCRGHTGFVTAMKVRGRTTLVTGSYDGTIRVWDLAADPTPTCTRTIKAEKIACLDFLLNEGIIAAGLYDTGRILLFDLHTGVQLHTLSGHNKGIRNIALNEEYLVSVGQDKAICVWDHRSGERIVRFGQQSNVSLGVSLVDKDKLVAVTIDGVIRSFSLRSKKMIGEFHLSKLLKNDSQWTGMSKELIAEGGMLSWFAAHRNSITLASKNLIIHLEWREHTVSVQTADAARQRRDSIDSLESNATSRAPSTAASRRRTDSNASDISSMSTSMTPSRLRTSGRPSLNGAGDAGHSPSPMRSRIVSGSAAVSPTAKRTAPVPSSPANSRETVSQSRRSSLASPLSPASAAATSIDSISKSSADSNVPSLAGGGGATRIAPNLATVPRIVSVLRTPEVAIGAIHPQKRRVVCSSRFTSRAGAQRSLFTSTYSNETEDDEHHREDASLDSDSFVPLRGAWDAHAAELSTPERNPMAIVLDHESIVVGCSDGLVYRVGFVGASYHPQQRTDGTRIQPEADQTPTVGDATIKHLDELRQVDGWKELFVTAA